ncbi:MAG: hypothetical protein ACRCYD_01815 [Plesiomonas sp.]
MSMMSLNHYLEENYIKAGNGMKKSEAVVEMAADLGASYSTVYSWLNSGDYVVHDACGSGDFGTIYVYKKVRVINV